MSHRSRLRKLAAVLGVPTAYFYCDDDNFALLLIRYAALGDSAKERVLALCIGVSGRSRERPAHLNQSPSCMSKDWIVSPCLRTIAHVLSGFPAYDSPRGLRGAVLQFRRYPRLSQSQLTRFGTCVLNRLSQCRMLPLHCLAPILLKCCRFFGRRRVSLVNTNDALATFQAFLDLPIDPFTGSGLVSEVCTSVTEQRSIFSRMFRLM